MHWKNLSRKEYNCATSSKDNYLKIISNINKINIPSNVSKIGEFAFNRCKKLRKVEILPDSMPNTIRHWMLFHSTKCIKNMQMYFLLLQKDSIVKLESFNLTCILNVKKIHFLFFISLLYLNKSMYLLKIHLIRRLNIIYACLKHRK